jgi:uncharacterized protein (TIRG00374 family)
MADLNQERIFKLLRYCIALVALGWLISRGDWKSTIDILFSIPTSVVILLFVFSGLNLLIRFFMWHSLLFHIGGTSYWIAGEINLIVNFVNQLLPSQLSGRSIAPILISRRLDVPIGTAIGIASFHTMLHALLYGVFATVGILVILDSISLSIAGILFVSAALYVIAGSIILLGSLNDDIVNLIAGLIKPTVQRIPQIGMYLATQFDRIPQFTSDAKETFINLSNSPRTISVYLFGWFGAVALFPSLRIFVLFQAFEVSFQYMIFLPIIIIAAYSVTLLPLTPGGIGIAEATAAAVFASLGVPYEIAASSILLDRVIGLYLPGLLGWYPTAKEDLRMK